MKTITRTAVLMIAVLFFVMPAAAKDKSDAVRMIPATFSQLAQDAKPGVVNIQTVKNIQGGGRVFRHFYGQPFGGNRNPLEDFFGPFMQQQPQTRKESSLGSGFIISEDGYIVTNNHVIKDADEIKVVMHDNKEYEGKIIGTDPMTDLALIKIDAKDLKPLTFGSSADLEVGSWVVAIGSPFGLEQTVTAGIVSAKGRIIGSGPYDDFIQTDASINPGNSGGPLLNMAGEVIGINTAIYKVAQGIGFAIPSDMATNIIKQLTEQKQVSRGWMGVAIQDITPELAQYYGIKEQKGVYVVKAYEDNPAYDAGIQAGDIIIEINGKAIESSRDLSLTIAGLPVGEKIKVKLIRDGDKKTIKVKLSERPNGNPDQLSQNYGYDLFGFRLKEMTADLAYRLGYPRATRGLVVLEIKDQSPASASRIRPGDILIEINRHKINSVEQYTSYLNQIEKGKPVQLLFRRGDRPIVVTFEKL